MPSPPPPPPTQIRSEKYNDYWGLKTTVSFWYSRLFFKSTWIQWWDFCPPPPTHNNVDDLDLAQEANSRANDTKNEGKAVVSGQVSSETHEVEGKLWGGITTMEI